MKWQCEKKDIIYIIICIFIILMFVINRHDYNKNNKNIIKIDTTYNTIVLDSIKYNIKIKDSIIYSIKYNYEYKYKEANSLDDSSTVELFKQLCTDN